MKNYVQDGCVITLPAPYAVSSGAGMKVGALFAVAATAAALGAPVEASRRGVFDLAAKSDDTGAVGDKVYWDDTNKRITTTATSNLLVGCLVAAKGGTDATARVLLDGVIR